MNKTYGQSANIYWLVLEFRAKDAVASTSTE